MFFVVVLLASSVTATAMCYATLNRDVIQVAWLTFVVIMLTVVVLTPVFMIFEVVIEATDRFKRWFHRPAPNWDADGTESMLAMVDDPSIAREYVPTT